MNWSLGLRNRRYEIQTTQYTVPKERDHDALATSCSLSPVLRGEGWGEGRCGELRISPKGPSPQYGSVKRGWRNSAQFEIFNFQFSIFNEFHREQPHQGLKIEN
jgi:hypothetical protein